ncbi:MAG: PAS domain S-box protein [Leptospira sp.]|nr:PAS domain S-box protein [Leptospira sp.]
MIESESLEQIELKKKLETLQFTQYSVDTISDAILWINESGKYVFVNNAAAKLYGYEKAELLTMVMFQIDPLFDEAKWRFHWNEILQKKTFKLETVNRRKDGTEFPIEVTVNLVEYNYQKYNCAIVRDISEQKLYERKLEETAARLQNLNAIKDRFFSIIAHDLRGPLGNYRDFTQLLKDKADILSKEEKNNYLELLERSSSQIYTLLENLLEWARSQNDTIPFDPHSLEIHSLVEKIIGLFSVSLQNKNISIQNKIPLTLSLFCDRHMTETIFRNLISNSIKYSLKSSSIEIGCILREDVAPILYVKDLGVGIKEVRLNKLFQLDQKISTKGTDGESGSGLGLILAKEFLERHQGKIWVESNYGHGAVFFFQFGLKENIIGS